MKKEKIEITLTEAQPKYAKALLDFYREVGSETPFLSFGEEGVGINQEQEQRYLKSIEGSNNNRVLIALNHEEIIGVASIAASQHTHDAHVGEMGIVILRQYWGFGLSNVLMEDMLDFASDSPVLHYIRLEVAQNNTRAIKLYERFDFDVIGRTPSAHFDGEQYQDTLYMGRSVCDTI